MTTLDIYDLLPRLFSTDSLTNIAIWVDSIRLYIFISPGGTRTFNEGFNKPGSGQLNRIMLYNKKSVDYLLRSNLTAIEGVLQLAAAFYFIKLLMQFVKS